MTTNYAAAAMFDLVEYGDRAIAAGMNVTGIVAINVAALIKKSQHFMLPDNGKIFDDGLRGLRGFEIKLPFPSITIEYMVKNPVPSSTKFETVEASRRVAIAFEVKKEHFAHVPEYYAQDEFDGGAICVYSAAYYEEQRMWCLCPSGLLMPKIYNPPEQDKKKSDKGCAVVSGAVIPVLPEVVQKIVQKFGVNTAVEMMRYDINDEARAVLELIEALTCKNVFIGTAREGKKSAKRERYGKPPLFEMKVLMLKRPGVVGSDKAFGGTHASPCQHLRRGHYRHLETGRIWVNSCVVGDEENGVIRKRYGVRRR